MSVSELPLALFVVFNGNKEIEYVVQRNDVRCNCNDGKAKGKLYFVNFILPELVAKRYSSVKAIPQTSTSRQQSALSDQQLNQFICYCKDPQKIEETIICASSFCVINEFQKSCTGSKRLSKSWMCTFCKKETASRKRKSGPINQQGCANAMDRYYLKSSSENERKFLESLFMLFYCSSLHLSIYFHRPNEWMWGSILWCIESSW